MVTRTSLTGYVARILLWAVLCLVAVIVVYPLAWMVLSAFKNNGELFGDPFGLPSLLRWENFARAWEAGVSNYLTTSIVVTVVSTIVTVIISAWAAYGLARLRMPFGKTVEYVIIGGLMLAPAVALIPLVNMFQQLGIYGTPWPLLIVYTAFRVPFTTFLIRAYMVDLPIEVEEAAMVDGASRAATFWRIILPMSQPIIVSAVILQVLFAWNEFLFAMIFTGSSELTTLPVGLDTLMGRHGTDYPVVFAAMLIAALPMVLMFFIGQRYFILGLAEGVGK